MSPLNAAICTTTYLERQKCYGPARKYYLKNNYLTLRSKVKVPRRSLRYATHRLMIMHPHTKYNWPIWKDKKIMVASLRRSRRSRSCGSGRKNQTIKYHLMPLKRKLHVYQIPHQDRNIIFHMYYAIII